MVTFAPPKSDADVLAVVMAGGAPTLSPELARWVLSLSFSDAQKARVLELVDRGNRETLTPDENQELHRYLRVGNLLNVLGAKSRLVLGEEVRSE